MFENDSDEYYSIKETVAMLGITTKTLSRHAKKLFPSTVESRGRRVRYSRADIDLIVESIENARTNAYHLDSRIIGVEAALINKKQREAERSVAEAERERKYQAQRKQQLELLRNRGVNLKNTPLLRIPDSIKFGNEFTRR